jgi:hypothetical protein
MGWVAFFDARVGRKFHLLNNSVSSRLRMQHVSEDIPAIILDFPHYSQGHVFASLYYQISLHLWASRANPLHGIRIVVELHG